MSIYDLDYNQKAVELNPPDKRFPRNIAWVKSLFAPSQYVRDKYLEDYRIGVTAPIWSDIVTYNLGNKVIYKGAVFVSKVTGNLGNQPIVGDFWELYQENFIGVEERVLFNGQKLILEYALNKWFHTTFRQPNLVSDIFIDTNIPLVSCFIIGGAESNSSKVFYDRSSEAITYDYMTGVFSNATINFPIAVHTALDPTPANRDKIIRNFADKYFPAGITYNIVTY